MSQELALPWPQRVLNPNSRGHWSVKAKSAKAYRYECFVLARMAKLEAPTEGAIEVHISFRPPSKRRYDLDNAIASIKNGLDGIADALGVNDSRFVITAWMGLPEPPGAVLVKIGFP